MTTHDIQRYAVSGDIAYPIHEDPEGDYVTYEDHIAAIEADRKRRGEPVLVGWAVSTTGKGMLPASRYTEFEARRAGYSLPVYRLAASQPANPSGASTLHKDDSGAQSGNLAPQPAEPTRGEPVACFKCGHAKHDGECVNVAPQPAVQSDAEIAETCRAMGANSFAEFFGKTAPQPAEPVKHHLKVSYDDKGDCLYVVCDSNEPADAEEDDKGILYRLAISDGRLVGITIMNFMGRHAESSDEAPRPAEPVKVPSDGATDAARWRKARTLPRSWWRDAFNRVSTPEELEALIDTHGERRLP